MRYEAYLTTTAPDPHKAKILIDACQSCQSQIETHQMNLGTTTGHYWSCQWESLLVTTAAKRRLSELIYLAVPRESGRWPKFLLIELKSFVHPLARARPWNGALPLP